VGGRTQETQRGNVKNQSHKKSRLFVVLARRGKGKGTVEIEKGKSEDSFGMLGEEGVAAKTVVPRGKGCHRIRKEEFVRLDQQPKGTWGRR